MHYDSVMGLHTGPGRGGQGGLCMCDMGASRTGMRVTWFAYLLASCPNEYPRTQIHSPNNTPHSQAVCLSLCSSLPLPPPQPALSFWMMKAPHPRNPTGPGAASGDFPNRVLWLVGRSQCHPVPYAADPSTLKYRSGSSRQLPDGSVIFRVP